MTRPAPRAAIILNPGAGPVDGQTTEAHARANMDAFVADATRTLGSPVTLDPTPSGEADGRWFFHVTSPDGTTVHEVEMPGLPLDRVRYVGNPDQNIWNFPRLYVDGSSWVWKYAIRMVGNDEGLD